MEQKITPERGQPEVLPERSGEFFEHLPGAVERTPERQSDQPTQRPPLTIQAPPGAALQFPTAKSPLVQQVESVLAQDLDEVYRDLSPAEQQKFKARGEEVASLISQMIMHLRVKANTVLSLIRSWLKLIPGINKLFLEQEAKIKTDRIVAIARQKGQPK